MSQAPLDSFWKEVRIVASLNKDGTPYTHIPVTLVSRLSYARVQGQAQICQPAD